MRFSTTIFIITWLVATAPTGWCQPERHELGERLKRFEQAWEKQTEPAVRKEALQVVRSASRQFLTLQLGEAGRTLDEARQILERNTRLTPEYRWLESLYIVPNRRIIQPAKATVQLEFKALYDTIRPKGGPVKVTVRIDDKPVSQGELQKLSSLFTCALPDLPGDANARELLLTVHLILNQEERELSLRLHQVRDLPTILQRAKQFVRETEAKNERTIETATVRNWVERLESLNEGSVPETDLPIVKMLNDLNQIEQVIRSGKPFFEHSRSGQFPLAIPVTDSRSSVIRISVPEKLTDDRKLPLVIGLHGAGGSENLFFEGYGSGQIVRECQKRGWLFVATRSEGLLGTGTPKVAEIIDQLSKRYPLDPGKIFLVGHSMGAGQAISLVQQYPGRFAGVACFGGAGRVREGKCFEKLPIFIGVGDQDFALRSSRSLEKALKNVNATQIIYKEYPDFEHLVIVREALPDAFNMFDSVLSVR